MEMVRFLVERVVGALNSFISKQGITTNLSLSTIVEGNEKLDLSRKMITFGTHALACIGKSNNMKLRAVPAIDLRRPNNA